jgi:hypothetical protein
LGAQAGELFQDFRQLSVYGEQLVDFGADAVGG